MDGLVAIEKNNDSSGGTIIRPVMSRPDYRAGDQVQPGSAIAQVIDPTQMDLTARLVRNREVMSRSDKRPRWNLTRSRVKSSRER